MTDILKEICRGLITGSRESNSPVFFYGDWGKVRDILKLIAIGASRCQKQPVFHTNSYMFIDKRVCSLIDAIPAKTENEDPKNGMVVFDSLERLQGEEDAIRRFEHLVETICDRGGQIVLGASCAPEELSFLSDRVCMRIKGGLVYPLEEEENRSPVWELMQMGLWPEKGRFAALYADKYLDMFSTEPTEKLSEEQMSALEEMKRIVGWLTELYRGAARVDISRLIHHPKYYSGEVPEEWNAEEVAFGIFYIFWNRFNCDEEGYEVGFARSGMLGAYLRRLKELDH